MTDSVFDGQILSEKLSKLNSSQQSIESLSRWCISNRKKARQIVDKWDKAFRNAQREQRVAFLYLANDILQNSRRKGSEFVNEFWKFLPAAVKHVYENGDDNGKKAACRLVDIWEERKVFGSRGQNLKDEMLGRVPPPSVNNGKSSNSIKIVKRDAHSLRIKLGVGGMPEKIVTAFQSVHDENTTEEAALNKCEAAASLVGKMEKDVHTSAQGNQDASVLADEILEQENVLKQCIGQLENAEASRAALVSQLQEAIQEQELKLEFIHTQLQVARGQVEQMSNMRCTLMSPPVPASLIPTNQPMEATAVVESHLPSTHPTITPMLQPVISFATLKNSEEENKKAAAAAVAAKLTASTSSAQMLTSVLSSLISEEAASKNGGLKSVGFTSSLPIFSPEKRPKLDKSVPVTDVNGSDMSNAGYFTSLQLQSMDITPLTAPTSMPPISQTNHTQAPFPPPLPPPPPVPPANSPPNQFAQSAGLMMGVMPFGYGGTNSLPPPPPPLPSHIALSLARPPPQSQQQQLQPANGGFFRPPGFGFYGQSHQPTPPPPPPPVPRH
ncbi:Regulation of nuclear pre-mRNA domain-containing protein [Actinidia chinensis var. chinensis]|uniref:Regulation of nuclear pre-mRNA domain-containing protein n=1 Tax=Actinidia chinensis var. chinensis TaxID=1590841 RepID=A0A2R6QVK6_ACTCC|nr:Regulation of nuclear pre-mRNA domain-containing protein [Actinidia chinensis var. chinensis]